MLTVVFTIPLLVLGAEVTSKKVGMADQQPFRLPWHLLTVFVEDGGFDLKLEHGHRFFGYLVGGCIIILNIGLWWKDPRRWVQVLGVVALIGVSVQGTFGIFRVGYNAPYGREFALIHGCFAHLVLAVLMSLAVVTTKSWQKTNEFANPPIRSGETYKLAVATCLVVYLQLILGGVVRHLDFGFASRLHVVVAAVVAAFAALLAKSAWDDRRLVGSTPKSVWVLLILLCVQLLLGVEAWLSRFFVQTTWNQLQPIWNPPAYGELIRSTHYLVGSLIFSATVVVALNARRQMGWRTATEATAQPPQLGAP